MPNETQASGSGSSHRANGGAPPAPPKLPACDRCRARKTKCDAALPACSACVKAGVECVGEDRASGQAVPRSYVWTLEQRVKELEQQCRSDQSQPTPSTALALNHEQQHRQQQLDSSLPPNTQGSIQQSQGPHQVEQSQRRQLEGQRPEPIPVSPPTSTFFMPIPQDAGGQSYGSSHADGFGNNQILSNRKDEGPNKRRRRSGEFRSSISCANRGHSSAPRSSPSPSRSSTAAFETAHSRSGRTIGRDVVAGRGSNRDRSSGGDALSAEGPVISPMDSLVAAALDHGGLEDVQVHLQRQFKEIAEVPERLESRDLFVQSENDSILRLQQDLVAYARRHANSSHLCAPSNVGRPLLARLAKRYFTWMNSTYPALHECSFALQLKNLLADEERSCPIDRFQVSMVLAISTASISRPMHRYSSELRRLAHKFWLRESGNFSSTMRGRALERLQCVLLLLQYTLLIPNAGNLWQLSGTATRLSTEMCLYDDHSSEQQAPDPLTLDVQRRVFWTCYCIDRMLATVLARPPGLPDEWITAQLPSLLEDRCITSQGIRPGPVCQLKYAHAQHVRLRLLQSEIHRTLYSARSAFATDDKEHWRWAWRTFDRLREWRDSFTYPTPFLTKEWMELQFHITTILLFRPSPRSPHHLPEGLHVALHAAAEMLRLYKVMHRDISINFAWYDVHNLFMGGLTFINSLKELGAHGVKICIPFVDVVLRIQACASVLEALSSLEGGAHQSIRNAFETVSTTIIRSLSTDPSDLASGEEEEACIWSEIAKSDDSSIQRPRMVQEEEESSPDASPISSFSPNVERLLRGGEDQHHHHLRRHPLRPSRPSEDDAARISRSTDRHFYEHDTDAASPVDLLDHPRSAELFTAGAGGGGMTSSQPRPNPSRSESFSTQEANSRTDRNRANEVVSATWGGDGGGGGGNVESRSASIHPEGMTEQDAFNLELERWFFYPLQESTNQMDPFIPLGEVL
ncbi:hypothetical protein IE53DRAFT_211347 [Violaceomyces palustris]|uniref:Uncharacterized protein n=1 Tax=Violaceomyces palustris TaxID=1673888 RepID=A0ACD0P4V4_9BASI|nr:hypothetical protein IE53DRAFT_211347 [Violaceomyces palustris]